MNHRNSNPIEAPSAAGKSAITIVYVMTVFLGAFLLFQVQPLIGKYILPWFGGGPEVWTTCMLFFQLLLLGGYAYAHLLASRFTVRVQVTVHVLAMGAALVMLPIIPQASWKPESLYNPVFQILLLVAACVGVPYLVLSATGPLMQRWFSHVHPGKSAYRLYAFSNAGSLLGLVSYPFLFEPVFSRQMQASIWGWGLGGFAVLSAFCGILFWRHRNSENPAIDRNNNVASEAVNPGLGTRLLWLALPAAACLELLAVTNKICLDIAAVPFLWVLPLSLYLLSFIICFDHQRWYVRPVFLIAFLVGLVVVIYARVYGEDMSACQQISMYSYLLFTCCMVCHGELFRLRPHPKYLTSYYLTIAAGGAIGGFFVAVIAPLIFTSYKELYVGLLASCLFLLLADKSSSLNRGRRRWVYVGLVLVTGMAAMFMESRHGRTYDTAVLSRRNFFGVLTVWEQDSDYPADHRYVLQHGTTTHGSQYTDPVKQLEPTTYYSRSSGAGLAIEYLQQQEDVRVGVVGLGVGTLAAYGRKGDYIRFYEINPQVTHLAKTRFTYLENCPANVEIIHGDARLSMQREPCRQFDLLALDAFSSDVVPVHLLTREAFEIYLKHIKPNGILAVHISSVHLDLARVVWKLADYFDIGAVMIEDSHDDGAAYSSDWLLLTNNEEFLELSEVFTMGIGRPDHVDDIDLWTDDYVNLFQIMW